MNRKINHRKFSQLLANEIMLRKSEVNQVRLCKELGISRSFLFRLQEGPKNHFVNTVKLIYHLGIDLDKIVEQSKEGE